MKLLSINVGTVQPIPHAVKPSQKTGIFKEPVPSAHITENGLHGDVVVDKKYHGGVDQAVYIYGGADYDWWSSQLDQSMTPGLFGENLTISDLESAPIHIGDRLTIGSVILEVTAPRAPCATFAHKMGDPRWIKRFQKAERPGLYCRVIESGIVQTGDPVTLQQYTGESVTIQEMFRFFYSKRDDEAYLRRALAAPISIRNRRSYEKRLTTLCPPSN
jgi:MOSC domain-containing protein YiiM